MKEEFLITIKQKEEYEVQVGIYANSEEEAMKIAKKKYESDEKLVSEHSDSCIGNVYKKEFSIQ